MVVPSLIIHHPSQILPDRKTVDSKLDESNLRTSSGDDTPDSIASGDDVTFLINSSSHTISAPSDNIGRLWSVVVVVVLLVA